MKSMNDFVMDYKSYFNVSLFLSVYKRAYACMYMDTYTCTLTHSFIGFIHTQAQNAL